MEERRRGAACASPDRNELDVCDAFMRTTITVDDSVYQALREQAAREKRPFKEVVNTVLRRGLEPDQGPSKPYHLPTFALGHPPKMDIDAGLRLVDELENQEIQRKLEANK